MTDVEISAIVEDRVGQFWSKHPNASYLAVASESRAGGLLDYVGDFKPGTLYVFNGVGMNKHEALNYMWGATLAHMRISKNASINWADRFHKYFHKRWEHNEPSHSQAILMGHKFIWNERWGSQFEW